MTKTQGRERLIHYCDNEIAKSGFWIFDKRKLYLDITRFLKSHEKSANLPLPKLLSLSYCKIDKNGIHVDDFTVEWDKICATGIKKEELKGKGENPYYVHHLMVCLYTGKISRISIGSNDLHRGLLGHFIEQYKIDYFAAKCF